jgi:hypothetical protein
MAEKGKWELKSGEDVAQALEWVRQRTQGKSLVLIAIGRSGIAYSKAPGVSAADAVQYLEDELANLKQGLQQADAISKRCGARTRREY